MQRPQTVQEVVAAFMSAISRNPLELENPLRLREELSAVGAWGFVMVNPNEVTSIQQVPASDVPRTHPFHRAIVNLCSPGWTVFPLLDKDEKLKLDKEIHNFHQSRGKNEELS